MQQDRKFTFLTYLKRKIKLFPIACLPNSTSSWPRIWKSMNPNIQKMSSKYIWRTTTEVEEDKTKLHFITFMSTPLSMQDSPKIL